MSKKCFLCCILKEFWLDFVLFCKYDVLPVLLGIVSFALVAIALTLIGYVILFLGHYFNITSTLPINLENSFNMGGVALAIVSAIGIIYLGINGIIIYVKDVINNCRDD